jgi:hypothetical protein
MAKTARPEGLTKRECNRLVCDERGPCVALDGGGTDGALSTTGLRCLLDLVQWPRRPARPREHTRTNDKEAAKRLLKDREGRAGTGRGAFCRAPIRITYDEAKADLVAYYKTSGNRDLQRG